MEKTTFSKAATNVGNQMKQQLGGVLDQMGQEFANGITGGKGDKAGKEINDMVSGFLGEVFSNPAEQKKFLNGLNPKQQTALGEIAKDSHEKVASERTQKSGVEKTREQSEGKESPERDAAKEKYLDSLTGKAKENEKDKSKAKDLER